MDIPNTLDNVQSARSVLSTFPFIDAKMTLRYLTYNVSGLLSKLDSAAFVNYITSFDFVCLTETYIASDFDSDLFRDLGIFVAKAKKLSSHGRLSGGVLVLVRKQFLPFVERMHVDVDNVVVLRMKKFLLGTDKDVMFIAAYLPPYDSNYWKVTQHGYGVEVTEKCVMDLHDVTDDFSQLLCGDLNTRTASENYNQVQDDCEDVLAKVCDCFPRKSQDNHTNVFGQQLIELCNMCECLILNGLLERGFDDSCTFVSNSGSSVVDYFLLSCDMLSSVCITSSEVENMIESDHLPVVLAINVSQNAAVAVDQSNTIQENRQAGLTEKIIWQEDKEPIFKKQLNSDEVQKTLEADKAKLEYDVDGALSDFVECLISASQSMVRKCHMNKHTKGAAWFDTECREAKRESKGKLRKFRKTRKLEDRKDYADSNKKLQAPD